MPLERIVNRADFRPRLVRFAIGLLFAILVAVAGFAWHRSRSYQTPALIPKTESAAIAAAPDKGAAIRFHDLAQSAGIDFVHVDGHTDIHYFPEVMGGGVAGAAAPVRRRL